MNRRQFMTLGFGGLASLGYLASPLGVQAMAHAAQAVQPQESTPPVGTPITDAAIRDYLYKMEHFDQPHHSDIILSSQEMALLKSTQERLARLQNYVGHGAFYLLTFDDARAYSRQKSIGAFTQSELAFMEAIFYTDAAVYGFLGDRAVDTITSGIPKKHIVKVPYMGNYLYREKAIDKWNAIHKLMGEKVVLTSGIRSVMKQFNLFLAKARKSNGNLSLASRSVAPPAYSFHSVGDFDVGQRGLGVRNFSLDFLDTEVYAELTKRGYIQLRYPQGGLLGVRFEPWHVRV
ncbi:MAG: M15 family metallopeptidase [Pseudomonadota bacterium]